MIILYKEKTCESNSALTDFSLLVKLQRQLPIFRDLIPAHKLSALLFVIYQFGVVEGIDMADGADLTVIGKVLLQFCPES